MAEARARTFGEFLHLRSRQGQSVRARLRPESDEGGAEVYDFYPDRRLLEDEFGQIWEAQAPHHPKLLTPALRARLFEVIFFQRPLKDPDIGR